MSTTGRTIAVLGATGRQGGQVARRLLEEGWTVRALTRSPDGKKAAELQRLGADVVRADLKDPASLAAAFAGVHGVYSVQLPRAGSIEVEIDQGRNVAAAAAGAHVQHVVYGSAGLDDQKRDIEQWDAKIELAQGFRRLGLPLTVLRPMAFMELMTDPTYFPQTSTWYTMPKLLGEDYPVAWLSVRDLGAIAAKAFDDPDRFAGRDLNLASDLRSIAQCREIYRDVRGRTPPRFPMPLFVFRRFVGNDLITMWRWLHDHPLQADTAETREILPEAMDVRTWLATTS
ncbi:NmrA/HSCARG family protein [Microbacterium atlanticum]|uniref:NmrA/HSCARG family protein n=1 Tax=Microbacterium atlanticum TaxID=2782168 RepID=UPI001887F517|nr:NmrA/HSCARG family protein [Microbacterium atlanticum]